MDNTARVRALNDAARATFHGCRVMLTIGVQQMERLPQVLDAVRNYSIFDEDDDPHGEHDFGSLTIGGQLLFWKFDYYDLDFQMASPDPTDPAVTARVLTIMLAEEY